MLNMVSTSLQQVDKEKSTRSSRVAIVVCISFSSPTAACEFLLLRVIRLLGDIERGVSSTCSFFLVDRGVIEINKLSLNEGLLAGEGNGGGGVDNEVAITSKRVERGRERGEGGNTRADGEQRNENQNKVDFRHSQLFLSRHCFAFMSSRY